MRKRVLVISDLHLGGAPGSGASPGFQMCSAAGQRRLARFFDWAAAQARSAPQQLELVIAGDVVDFLAEATDGSFSPLTLDQTQAKDKLEAIFRHTPEVWPKLAGFVATGARLVLLLGNHDVELCLPKVRERLVEALGPGRIEMLYDNQALTYGPVLIEHGNRHDRWNAVFHDSLRRARSRLSRGLPAGPVPLQPGSQLVVDVMNPIKRNMAFVDLLKPERAGVLPILAFLYPARWLDWRRTLRDLLRAAMQRQDDHGEPRDQDKIAADADIPFADDEMFRMADALATGRPADQIGADDSTPRPPLWERIKSCVVDAEIALLHKSLRAMVDRHQLTFDTTVEEDEYRVPALERAKQFKVVVYGHTHLVKKLPLGGALYLNSGTWADLIRIPDAAFDKHADAATALREFLDDMVANRLEPWRRLAPTFVDIRVDGESLEDATVWFFDEQDRLGPVDKDSLHQRLARRP